MEIFGSNAYMAWVRLLRFLFEKGSRADPRGRRCVEKIAVTVRVNNPLENVIINPHRNLNYRFMIAEWLWIMTGDKGLWPLARVNSQLTQFSDDGVILAGAYGPRWRWQWNYLKEKLQSDEHSRQGVISLWTPAPQPSKDIPCTISLQFLIRERCLHTIVTMRSSDVWLGFPYDIFCFTQMANWIASQLRVSLGEFVMNIGSSHLYAEHYLLAARVLDTEDEGGVLRSPRIYSPIPSRLILYQNPREYFLYHQSEAAEGVPTPWHRYYKAIWEKRSVDALAILYDLEAGSDTR